MICKLRPGNQGNGLVRRGGVRLGGLGEIKDTTLLWESLEMIITVDNDGEMTILTSGVMPLAIDEKLGEDEGEEEGEEGGEEEMAQEVEVEERVDQTGRTPWRETQQTHISLVDGMKDLHPGEEILIPPI